MANWTLRLQLAQQFAKLTMALSIARIRMLQPNSQITQLEPALFAKQGYLVKKRLIRPLTVLRLRSLAKTALSKLIGPIEFEAEVGYPGAPITREAKGGNTPRRLLYAYARDRAFAELALTRRIKEVLVALMGTDELCLSQNHHNCVMTKYPDYSSSTGWHQDIRYWSFDRPELISVWCALGDEMRDSGALLVVPGSHNERVGRGRLDRDLFLRTDLAENQSLLRRQKQIELERGDVLFFHCRLFHAAGRNLKKQVKLSTVFTYHACDNRPIPGTRSDRYPPIPLHSS